MIRRPQASLSAVALILALVLAPSWASAWNQTKTSKGKLVQWSSACHAYYVNEEGSHQVDDGSDLDAVQASFQAWTDVECSSLAFQFAGETNFATTGYSLEESPINLVVFRDKKWPYTQRPVAFTAVTYNKDDGLILDADIELNEQDYAFTTTPDKEHWKIDLQNTLTHEIGHTAGLDHSTLEDSTMYFHAAPGESSKRTLEQDDTDGLCTLYPEDGKEKCTVLEPQYLFIDFPQGNDPGGCSAAPIARAPSEGPSRAGLLPHGLLLLGASLLLCGLLLRILLPSRAAAGRHGRIL